MQFERATSLGQVGTNISDYLVQDEHIGGAK